MSGPEPKETGGVRNVDSVGANQREVMTYKGRCEVGIGCYLLRRAMGAIVEFRTW